jgi:hypothetical protein
MIYSFTVSRDPVFEMCNVSVQNRPIYGILILRTAKKDTYGYIMYQDDDLESPFCWCCSVSNFSNSSSSRFSSTDSRPSRASVVFSAAASSWNIEAISPAVASCVLGDVSGMMKS